MRDPHVKTLTYSIRHRDDTSFVEPRPVDVSHAGFVGRLDAGILTVTMGVHTASTADARALVNPVLRAWELQDELLGTRTGLEFVFERADVVDRDPPPSSGPSPIELKARISGTSFLSARLHVSRRHYPPPPDCFIATADVETMWLRYTHYLQRREPLPSVAYYCLTVIEGSAGSRQKAAGKYSVDAEVLRKLGELSSTRGDPSTARKATGAGTPLTNAEVDWVEATVRRLVARVAEIAGGRAATQLTMADLPRL